MLTLFLMLGAAYIVAATRARASARAFARLTFGSDESRMRAASLLDAVFLQTLAGGTTAPTGLPEVAFESLLADKYGPPSLTVSGTASAVSIDGPIIQATVEFGVGVRPADLNGRVLSFVAPGRPATSHRILRATRTDGQDTNAASTSATIYVDRPFRRQGLPQPQAPVRVVVNGREFSGEPDADPPTTATNETWDGFDAHNPFLARLAPVSGNVSRSEVTRFSFLTAAFDISTVSPTWDYDGDSIPDAADNDNDGVIDGVFLDWNLPTFRDSQGNTVDLRASVLVVDLDGRFNVNAHGSWASLIYPDDHPGWSEQPGLGDLDTTPLGTGYGPAEIAANTGAKADPKSPKATYDDFPRMFDVDQLVAPSEITERENPKLVLLGGAAPYAADATVPRQRGVRRATSRFSESQETPRLLALDGKYGEQPMWGWTAVSGTTAFTAGATEFTAARPGAPLVDDPISRISDRRASPASPESVNYGIPMLWWTGRPDFNWAPASTAIPPPRGIYNSPPDLHGRMKTLTIAAKPGAIVPQLVFAQPEWSSVSDARETKDDPYEIFLDTRRGFSGWLHDPGTLGMTYGALDHNPFVPAELEAVLRPYDIDTNRCPPRLAALLGTAAESSRLKVTTESWDTTALVGGHSDDGAAARVRDWLAKVPAEVTPFYGVTPVAGVINGDIARGEKFDLNRALAASTSATVGYSMTASEYHIQRQAYFKDLYTLLVALEQADDSSPPPVDKVTALAQWAANVVEFRDADSRVIPFEYDVNPQNGWSVDGDVTTDEGGERRVVWGCERPEMVIQEAVAWRKDPDAAGMLIAVHRPWNAKAFAADGATNDPPNVIDAEPCDYALDTLTDGDSGQPTNRVDLGKKAGPHVVTAGTNPQYDARERDTYPIWRLRLVSDSGTKLIRFDTDTATGSDLIAGGADKKPEMGPDSTLVVYSSETIDRDLPHSPITAGFPERALKAQVTNLEVPSPDTEATLYLERLSDPAHKPTPEEWAADPLAQPDRATSPFRYIVVDAVPIRVTNTGMDGEATIASSRREMTGATNRLTFWRTPGRGAETFAGPGFPTPVTSPNVAWWHHPNRPFVSSAELLLVGHRDARKALDDYERIDVENQASRGVPLSNPKPLFDAVHVPTRFGGIHTTTTTTGSLGAAAGVVGGITPANQFSSFREPGRVNINTITTEEVWNTVVAGPLGQPVVTGATASLGIVTGGTIPKAVQTMAEALTLERSGSDIVSDEDCATSVLAHDRNSFHELFTATRLANTITTRSNVFAVWVTVRLSVADDPDSVKYYRAFYIVDRSLPVAYDGDGSRNAWDCVRLRRIIE